MIVGQVERAVDAWETQDHAEAAHFKALARRLCVGHAHVHPVRWNCPVEVFGRVIRPGQLIHADKHGFLAVPPEDEAGLLEATRFMDANECETVIPAARGSAGLPLDQVIYSPSKRPFTVVPQATLDRPLSVITLRTMQPAAFLGLMVDALKDRNGVRANEHVHIRTDVSEVVLRRLTSMPFQVDGDYLGEAESLHFRHHPDAVRLVVPVGFTQ